MNPNVRLALVISVSIGVADSIWSGTILATYLYDLGNKSNTFVGASEALIGLTELFVALPIGAFADSKDSKGRSRKVVATRLACPAIAIASVLSSIVIYYLSFTRESSPDEKLLRYSLVGVLMLWGLAQNLVLGPFQALFAESLPTGARSKYYAYLYAGYIGSSSCGPLLSIALFVAWGNEWSLGRLAKVLLVGFFLEFLSAPLFLFFKSSALLGAEADSAGEHRTVADDNQEEGNTKIEKRVSFFGKKIKTSNFVPWIMFIASLASSLGSGMTVKFFPLYFKETVGLNPIQVQFVYTAVPIAMVFGMAAAQRVHTFLGRVQTLIFFKAVAVGLLIVMIVLSHGIYRHSAFVLIPIYIVRTALANCTYPIEESILMDFCPRDQRARWKSLESISSFGWCGSALIGGVLADKFAYTTTFGATAALQTLSIIILLALLPVVPRKERDLRLTETVTHDEESIATSPLTLIDENNDDGTLTFTAEDGTSDSFPISSEGRFLSRLQKSDSDEDGIASLQTPLLE